MSHITLAGAALAVCLSLAAPLPAQAAFTFNITEQASGVVVSGAGSIDLSGLTLASQYTGLSNVLIAAQAQLWRLDGYYSAYAGLSGPTSFGSGSITQASGFSGQTTGILGDLATLVVPEGYVSGALLVSEVGFVDESFSSLGLTPGKYVWTWASDSLTVQIGVGATAPIPEPASALLLGAGLLGLAVAGTRRAGRARHGRADSQPDPHGERAANQECRS